MRAKTFNEQDVLQKAMLLFWEKGYNATSISDLEKTTGVVRTSLYHSYNNKEGLFLAALDVYINHQCAGWIEIMEAPLPLLETLDTLFDAIITHNKNTGTPTGCMVAINAMLIESVLPATQKELERSYDQILHALERLFDHHLQTKTFKNQSLSPRDLAIYIFGNFQGIMLLSRARNNDVNLSPIKEHSLRYIETLLA